MNSPRETTIIAYVPTPHSGYLNFFRSYKDAELFILGKDYLEEFSFLTRNLPANTPEEVEMMVSSVYICRRVSVLCKNTLGQLSQEGIRAKEGSRIVMPDEDVSRAFAQKYVSGPVTFDTSWKLRWDWGSSRKGRVPEDQGMVSSDVMHIELMSNATIEASKSPDWWRQVGALLVRDGEPLLVSFNQHLPSEQSAYCYGDPRTNFEPGQRIDLSLALHAEIGVLTEAARRGIKTEGCDLYVTTFPCPPCARACANAGIRRLYYAEGYSLVDGAEALRSRDVEIIRVTMP